MTDSDPDPRLAPIYEAAYAVFTTYGFKRTTMDDIARQAGMSRPSLYTHFRNKEAIFRGYVELFFGRIVEDGRAALAANANVGEGISAFLETVFVASFRDLLKTPHGMELAGVNKEIAGDLFRDWIEAIEAVLAGWLEEKVREGRLVLGGLPAAALARLLVDAAEGIKSRDMEDAETARAEMALLALMAERAYAPRRPAGDR